MTDFTKLSYSSASNYQQIFLNSSASINGSSSVVHGLGAVPYIRVWAEQVSGEISPIAVASASTTYHDDYAAAPQVNSMSISSTTFAVNTSAALLIYYRIYLDVSG